jgi:Protein of unknown function (DUF3108)
VRRGCRREEREQEWHYCGVSAAGPIPSVQRRWQAPRRRAALALLSLVLLLHFLLLDGLGPGAGTRWRVAAPKPLLVRQITRPPAAPAAVAADALAVSAAPAPVATRPATARAVAVPKAQPRPAPAVVAAPVVQETESPQPHPPDPGGLAVPVYATQRPPPRVLQFELHRGTAVGQASMQWQPEEAQYRLRLQGQVAGAPAIDWSSQGGYDDAGLAPLRYTESRRGREVRAANFQRDNARVTFSGPGIEHPLVPGGQDRLSWMVQLAAVMAANPALAEPEAQVSIWVVGSRGDADVWTFTVQGRAALDLPIGRVEDTLHLVREPRRPYDTQVQVWLDPARHFLPAQALLRVRATGEGTEFRLQDLK